MDEFANELRKRIIESDKDITQLSRECEVSRQSIYKFINSNVALKNMKFGLIWSLCKAVHLEIR